MCYNMDLLALDLLQYIVNKILSTESLWQARGVKQKWTEQSLCKQAIACFCSLFMFLFVYLQLVQ